MALFDKFTQKSKETIVAVTDDELHQLIADNKYNEADSLATSLQKYSNLCTFGEQPLEKRVQQKLHDAKLAFVNTIVLPTEKKDILDFLAHTMHHTRTGALNDAINLAANIGFKAAKTANTVGKMATLGLAGKVLDNAEKLTKKALTTKETELANAWTLKLQTLIRSAKDLYGGMFGGDKDFLRQIDDLKKQLNSL